MAHVFSPYCVQFSSIQSKSVHLPVWEHTPYHRFYGSLGRPHCRLRHLSKKLDQFLNSQKNGGKEDQRENGRETFIVALALYAMHVSLLCYAILLHLPIFLCTWKSRMHEVLWSVLILFWAESVSEARSCDIYCCLRIVDMMLFLLAPAVFTSAAWWLVAC